MTSKALNVLAQRKGLFYKRIGGVDRLIWPNGTSKPFGTEKALLLALEGMPDKATDLKGLSVVERDAKVAEMMQKAPNGS
jgi:hypothetical protein